MSEDSEIPIYMDDDEEERDYWRELNTWIERQPQDAWALLQKSIRWDDQTGAMFEWMVEDEDCDLAVAARIFWYCEIGYYVKSGKLSSLAGRIVDNFNAGYYRKSEIAMNRFEILSGIQFYSLSVAERGDRPFEIPRALFGPFRGREPSISVSNNATRRHLEEAAAPFAGKLCYTYQDWKQVNERDFPERHYFNLPSLPGEDVDLNALDEPAFITAVYGKTDDYMKARKQLNTDQRPSDSPLLKIFQGEIRFKARKDEGNKQFFEGI